MVSAVEQRPHMQRFAVLSTVVKATIESVESVAVLLVVRVQHQHLKLNSDSENEIVAAKAKKETKLICVLIYNVNKK